MDDWTRLRLLAPKWWWYVSAPGLWAAVVFVTLAYAVMVAFLFCPLCRGIRDGQDPLVYAEEREGRR